MNECMTHNECSSDFSSVVFDEFIIIISPRFKIPTSLLKLHESATINLSYLQFTDTNTTAHHACHFIPQGKIL